MNLCIIVPCYNEAERIPLTAFETFLSHASKTEIYFVNDGSSDTTSELLYRFRRRHPRQVELIDFEKNLGKGNAVREEYKLL
jgi:glycosyltransferase involved in cell wall biosynthesis